MKTKLFALLVVICLLAVPFFAACENDSDESKGTASGEGMQGEYQNADGKYVGSYSVSDWKGETITFLTCSVNTTYESEILYNTYEDGTTKSMPELLNENLKFRSDFVEETLGVKIKEMKVHDTSRPGGGMCTAIRNGNLSATTDYQIVVPCLYDGATLAVEGQLHNLLGEDFENLQIEAPWWNQDFNSNMTFGGQLYFTIGDLGTVNKGSTAAMFFNLELWEKYGLSETYGGNPYELVRDGKWTVDTVFEAAQTMGQDVTNDGKIDYSDEFGWGGQLDDMWSIFYASGEKIAKNGADGYPELSMYNERSAKLMGKLQEFVQDTDHYISANDYFGVVQWPSVLVEEGFTDGRALFYNGSVGTVINLGVMEQHFGILPLPKADAEQENYYSLVNPWTSTCFAVPTCVSGDSLTLAIDVLNVMGAESLNTVAPNYQEILEYMKIRDDDSADMLNNYILPNRGCDVGMVYKWGALDTLLHDMASANVGTFASSYEAKATAAQNDLEETVSFFESNAK
ncbi:MAG: hypothetical protein IKK70_04570 [Clostridia bacterium]|nr:hypothetical protein [Clostridia bacterium]